jgi:hypothetical protein
MGTLLMLALGAWALLGGKKNPAGDGGAKRTSRPTHPALEPLPTYGVAEVFPGHDEPDMVPEKPAAEAAPVAVVDPSPGTKTAQASPGEVVHEVVHPDAPDADAPEVDVLPKTSSPEPVAVAPSKGTEAARANPGEVVHEVVQSSRTPEQAASELAGYARECIAAKNGAQLGSKNNPSAFVSAAQDDMGIAADGIYGPATRARGEKLGVKMPVRR